MAYNQYTAEEIGIVAVKGADKGLVLGQNVARYTDADFLPGHGGKAYLRIPGAVTARSRTLRDETTAVIFDKISENRVSVDLTTHLISAVAIGDAELTLDIRDFTAQVLKPQVTAVVDGIETVIADIDATDATAGYDEAKPAALFTKGRRALRTRGVDVANEALVAYVGGNIVDALLDSGALDFARTGDADALRKGSLGRIAGFSCVESGRIGADEVVFATKSGIYLATKTPKVPEGASFGASVSDSGIALRYLRDYDAARLTDRSIVSTFVGAGISPLYDVTRNQTTGAATVAEVEGGAVVKLATT
ncbi:P22 phage major capsid protein family protein [Microbacterium sp. IEGM 1404]|uniref:P22 phage major capsid protein family protein n=1 Tax=Microbacterium sp. IEGM 1404 TaxID=3047084 RepID=UPI0024B73E6D|nr:P22 phage major capsid protein family protein [Microbacterium sp. IEGM 1404]MDI9890563.1 P22 phage major capsid protein family protein [Microbacterium sp. IEGM 1404]